MKICFINHDNYPVLNPGYGGNYIGGESVQQILLAKALVRMGHEVSTIVSDLGQPDGEIIDGIKVWKTCRQEAGLPVLRFVYPRMTSFFSALKKADADVYYQSCAGVLTGFTAYFCKKNKRKYIFRVAHDTDCIPGQELIDYSRDRMIYKYGLKNADIISVQSEKQAALLVQHYGSDSVLINMAVETPEPGSQPRKDVDVLWVNNIRPFKRPDIMLEIARRLPDIKFRMIGGPCDGYTDLYENISLEAEKIANLEFMGFVPYHEVNQYYSRTKVFINTSDSEGFPNSFLQSWVRGIPVISYFDPDGVIERESIGESPDTIEEMLDMINIYISDEAKINKTSLKTREYALKNFAAESVAAEYINVLDKLDLNV